MFYLQLELYTLLQESHDAGLLLAYSEKCPSSMPRVTATPSYAASAFSKYY